MPRICTATRLHKKLSDLSQSLVFKDGALYSRKSVIAKGLRDKPVENKSHSVKHFPMQPFLHRTTGLQSTSRPNHRIRAQGIKQAAH
jgi:hypothetical protein